MSALISKVAKFGKKILIIDVFGLLPPLVVDALKDEAKVEKIWNVRSIKEETREFSLVIDLHPTHNLGFVSVYCIPPFIEIMLVDKEEGLPRLKERYDFERTRKGVIHFFTSYFDADDK